jgi:hypothetical protein
MSYLSAELLKAMNQPMSPIIPTMHPTACTNSYVSLCWINEPPVISTAAAKTIIAELIVFMG